MSINGVYFFCHYVVTVYILVLVTLCSNGFWVIVVIMYIGVSSNGVYIGVDVGVSSNVVYIGVGVIV